MEIMSLSCLQDKEILLVLYTRHVDIACPVYRTGRYCLACKQDSEILLVLYAGQVPRSEILLVLYAGQGDKLLVLYT